MIDIDDLSPYRGPLGHVEQRLVDRRIAVVTDPIGRAALVRPDSVLVEFSDDEYPHVDDVLTRRQLNVLGGAPAAVPPPSGLVGARQRQHEDVQPSARSIDDARALADRLRADGLRIRPNHVYLADGVTRFFNIVGDDGSSGTPGLLPAESLDSTVRPASPLDLSRPLRLRGHVAPNVLVLDTGLRTKRGRAPEHPALTNCFIHPNWLNRGRTGRFDDEDEPDDDRGGGLDFQAGHGTFVSGIIRQICPDAVVHTSGALTSYGDGDHASIVNAIERALARRGTRYDIVVMAFGTYGDVEDSARLRKVIERRLATSVVVASAGNDATSRQYYPAALPDVIAVGALDQAGRAAFSNFGSWVDACAPGVDVVSTFFTDFTDRRADGTTVDPYDGWARWSGTSFAAPKVAAVIAQEMYVHGGTADEAWKRLTARPKYRRPDLGQVFDV